MAIIKYRANPESPWQRLWIKIAQSANDIKTQNGKSIQEMLDSVYPVGAIYMSTVDTSPAGVFGGTWERIKDTFLLAAGDSYSAGDVGGEINHTLSVEEMPAHNHLVFDLPTPEGEFTNGYIQNTDHIYCERAWFSITGSTGGNQPHNNMPPYLTIYMWKRTA